MEDKDMISSSLLFFKLVGEILIFGRINNLLSRRVGSRVEYYSNLLKFCVQNFGKNVSKMCQLTIGAAFVCKKFLGKSKTM